MLFLSGFMAAIGTFMVAIVMVIAIQWIRNRRVGLKLTRHVLDDGCAYDILYKSGDSISKSLDQGDVVVLVNADHEYLATTFNGHHFLTRKIFELLELQHDMNMGVGHTPTNALHDLYERRFLIGDYSEYQKLR